MSAKDIARWEAAAHAMQSGVAVKEGRGLTADLSPKHLRVGVNTALVDHGSLAELLIAKGFFTRDEYEAAIANGMEREKARYETEISELLGRKVTLG